MGLSCCVPGCSHKNGRELCSLYNFPNENDGSDWKQWYDLWCERIGKSQKGGSEHGHGWLPTTWSRVCSCHFKEEERWKPRTRQPGLKFRAPIYFPFTNGSSGNFAKSAPMNKTPLLAGLRVDTGMKSSLLAGLNVKIVPSDKESDPSSKQNSRSPPTDIAGSHSPNSQTTKREILDADEISAKKSKIKYDDNEKMDSDGEYSTKLAKDHGSTAMNLSTTSTKKSEDSDVVLVTSEGKKFEMPGQRKSGPKDSVATLNERLLKALTQTNSPAVQVINTPSPASNSPVPMNMSGQSSASAYSSLVQMNAKSQIPGNTVISMSNRTLAPQSKYAELLAVIEDMGRDIRPTYSGSRTATERLKRGIVHARALVRECLAETERSARS